MGRKGCAHAGSLKFNLVLSAHPAAAAKNLQKYLVVFNADHLSQAGAKTAFYQGQFRIKYSLGLDHDHVSQNPLDAVVDSLHAASWVRSSCNCATWVFRASL